MFPAIVLAHLEQKHAQGVVAGEAGVGDMAVLPDCPDEFGEFLHGFLAVQIFYIGKPGWFSTAQKMRVSLWGLRFAGTSLWEYPGQGG